MADALVPVFDSLEQFQKFRFNASFFPHFAHRSDFGSLARVDDALGQLPAQAGLDRNNRHLDFGINPAEGYTSRRDLVLCDNFCAHFPG
jgi:hypothetical protein